MLQSSVISVVPLMFAKAARQRVSASAAMSTSLGCAWLAVKRSYSSLSARQFTLVF